MMRNIWKELALAIILAWGIPWVAMAAAEVAFSEEAELPVLQTQPTQQAEFAVQLWQDGSVREIPISEYLTGVLLSEMPGSFSQEAKKAQAVVSRTYTLRRLGGSDKHPGMVCDDSRCCQGFTEPATYADPSAVISARQAVEDTEDLVLTYGGELIDATYFSCSGGMTEDAVAVWGSDVPYLQAVESPGEEIAAHFTDTVFVAKEQLEASLGVSLTGENWLGAATYTEGGGVASMTIGGKIFRGTELRSALGLRSTAFTAQKTDGGIAFTTKGYGHRVGMSQYGAQAMALRGSTYGEILRHYYQGAELAQLKIES